MRNLIANDDGISVTPPCLDYTDQKTHNRLTEVFPDRRDS
jgi:hypothetical protein